MKAALVFASLLVSGLSAATAPLGLFTGPSDVGGVTRPTIASYDPAAQKYTISASGDNMWAQRDAFGLVWKQVSGDVMLTAEITLTGTSDQGHRKAALIFRQSLAPDSAYVDVAVHGDGLTSLQFRSDAGGLTREIQAPIRAPQRVRLEKRGDYVVLSVAGDDGVLAPSGCSIRLPFEGSFYAGLAVCAHDNAAFETATFSRVELESSAPAITAPNSALEIIPLTSLDRKVVYRSAGRIASPHFSRAGDALFFNASGRIHRLDIAGTSAPVPLDTGFAVQCNDAHGISPDGTQLVFGDLTETGAARLYLVPVTGGVPARIHAAAPAWWRSWAPDGQRIAYEADYHDNHDVYTLPLTGGGETRLTETPEVDGGPDYSADGAWIYFHSARSGSMQIWRMHPDGTTPAQITNDDYQNWFPHPSPDGKSIVFLSTKLTSATTRPPEGDYSLRLLSDAEQQPREIARFFGGDGSLNVPSWSPDSAFVAFVTYEPHLSERPREETRD